MSVLALPVLKHQLCLLRYSAVSGRRAQSTLLARLAQLSSQAESTPPPVIPATASASSSTVPQEAISDNPLEQTKSNKKKSRRTDAKKKVPRRNLLEESKIQSHLDAIAETSNTVTLADINRLRPRNHSEPDNPKYEEEYHTLVDRLCRSFSKNQLKDFVEMLEIEQPRRTKAKQHYAAQIIEGSWGWPSLTEVQAKKRDWSEMDTESFPLNPQQAFLILGKDGTNIHALSRTHNVHISFSSRPLCLNVEGLRGALKQVKKHIAAFKENISEEYYNLSSDKPIPAELLQRISRLSGALTEQFGNGQIRLTFFKDDAQPAFIAKRLLTHVLCDLEPTFRGSILAYVPPDAPILTPVPVSLFPHSYALYPFLSSRSLPWNVNASGAFRARKVAEWIGLNSREDVQKSGGLELGRGRVLNMEENPTDIRQKLFSNLPAPSMNRSRVITAVLGHVLLTPTPTGYTSLIPPLQGSWPISKLLKWVREDHVGRLFTPALPAPALQFAPQKQRFLHRLVYEARATGNTLEVPKVLEFEMVLPSTTVLEDGISELAKANPPTEPHLSSSLDHVCRIGYRSTIDLMLPDRPMDIRFSALDSSIIPETQWPRELQSYFKDLSFFFHDVQPNALRPNAPVTIHLDNAVYRLRSSNSVRQAETTAQGLPAITENVLDLEVDDKSTFCKITCTEPFTEEDWRAFLKGCDFLSGMTVAISTKTSLDSDPDISI